MILYVVGDKGEVNRAVLADSPHVTPHYLHVLYSYYYLRERESQLSRVFRKVVARLGRCS